MPSFRKSCTYGETGIVESKFCTMKPTSVVAFLKRRRWNIPPMILTGKYASDNATS